MPTVHNLGAVRMASAPLAMATESTSVSTSFGRMLNAAQADSTAGIAGQQPSSPGAEQSDPPQPDAPAPDASLLLQADDRGVPQEPLGAPRQAIKRAGADTGSNGSAHSKSAAATKADNTTTAAPSCGSDAPAPLQPPPAPVSAPRAQTVHGAGALISTRSALAESHAHETAQPPTSQAPEAAGGSGRDGNQTIIPRAAPPTADATAAGGLPDNPSPLLSDDAAGSADSRRSQTAHPVVADASTDHKAVAKQGTAAPSVVATDQQDRAAASGLTTAPTAIPAAATLATADPPTSATRSAMASASGASYPAHVPEPASQIAPTLLTLAKAADGSQQMTVRLNPVELGMVQIQFDRAPSGITQVKITTDRPETLQALQRDQPALHQTLDEAGVSSAGRTIEFHSAHSETFSTTDKAAQQAAMGSPGRGGTSGSGGSQNNTNQNPTNNQSGANRGGYPNRGAATLAGRPSAGLAAAGIATTPSSYRLGLNITA